MVATTQINLKNGWQLHSYDTASSTSDILFAASELTEGFAALARQQTAGRGRRGAQWSSQPNDGMYLSVALCPTRPQQDWPTLSFIAALSLKAALSQLVPSLSVGLKWPNDLLVGGCKLSGLLLEARGDYVVLGCGVNLKNAPVIDDISFPPTDIYAQTGLIIDPQDLAICFLDALQSRYEIWQSSGFSSFYPLYKEQLLFLGKPISVNQAGQMLTGIFEDMREDGALILKSETNTLNAITAGDVNLMGTDNASGN